MGADEGPGARTSRAPLSASLHPIGLTSPFDVLFHASVGRSTAVGQSTPLPTPAPGWQEQVSEERPAFIASCVVQAPMLPLTVHQRDLGEPRVDIYLSMTDDNSAPDLLLSLRRWLLEDPSRHWTIGSGDQPDEAIALRLADTGESAPALFVVVTSWMRSRPQPPSVTVTTASRIEARISPGVTEGELGDIAELLAARSDQRRADKVRDEDGAVTQLDHHAPVPPSDGFTARDSHGPYPGGQATPPGPVLDPGDDWPRES